MSVPIIIAAFGTTSRARTVYQEVDAYLHRCFPRQEIQWAFTSRTIRHHLKHRSIPTFSPGQVIDKLAQDGYSWAVVQSFNMICGHEFYRLVSDVQHPCCRVSMGHSLLCSQADHQAVAQALAPLFEEDEEEAVVLVGHGTDHCNWTVYPAFYQRLKQIYGRRAFGGMIEEGYPGRYQLISEIKTAGFKRVRLVPFMLIAGVHFEEDLAGPKDSWKTACQAEGLVVSIETQGIGSRTAILDIFCRHIKNAHEIIPTSTDGNRQL